MTATTKRKLLMGGVALFCLIVILVWVQGGFHSKVPGGKSPLPRGTTDNLRTVDAVLVRDAGDVTVSGSVTSKETARVASRVLGHVVELKVDAGDKVEKGQTLLRMDGKDLREREAQAEASLESAKSDLVKARNDFERFKALYEKESVAKRDYDDAVARHEVAQAAEARARAALDEARTLVAYGTVTAPFSGIVAERTVNVGDLATPGRHLLSVYMPGALEMVASVGEQYAAGVQPGASVTLAVPSISLKQKSAIREIVPQRDEKTRTITVKAPMQEVPGLVPGLYGTLSFGTGTSEIVAVPRQALQTVGQLENVRVLEDGIVKIRSVKTGRTMDGDKVEILSGLKAGEKVLIEQRSP